MIDTGKYYAAPVQADDPAFEIEMMRNNSSEGFTGQRHSVTASQPQSETDQLKSKVKSAIDEIKKDGFKAAIRLFNNFYEEFNMDEREQRAKKEAAAYRDPMDPNNAFALNETDKIIYEPVYLLENKDKNTDYFQFRTKTAYGVLQRISDGLWREVSFAFPSHAYAEKHYPLEMIQGESNANWRREDCDLHKMRVHYLSLDKTKANAAAAMHSLKDVQAEWFAVDKSSTRNNEQTRFSEPRFHVNGKSGTVTLSHVYAWFLPRLTQSGRQIQYNWDALRIRIMQGDKLINRFISWTSEVGSEAIKSQRTGMALSDGGYIGDLEEGQYQLSISIYDEEVFNYPFEVVKTVSNDLQNSVKQYYTIRTPRDDYANVILNNQSWDLDVYYPAVRLLDKCGSLEKFELAIAAEQNGKPWMGYEWNEFEKGGLINEITVREKANWAQGRIKLSIPVGSHPTDYLREQALFGDVTLHILLDGEKFDEITLNIGEKGFVKPQDVKINHPLADIDFPDLHDGQLLPLS
ncbi:hypothetical protein D5018_18875 [Parashewanella curva]|uniref:Uncharacterized protein n=1 Tax=Parashewanella curva TaxID=2338552 RepID=A0A3L8PRV4_9GAMM|nr:hypothetical protein [Parashewanella curva]RLV58140.1 hypothetical protein D5018_18875 [Parashewanella curva]